MVVQRHDAMHIAKVVRKYKDREYVSWFLRRSFRSAKATSRPPWPSSTW
jgi:hypothetical protein